MGDNIILIGMPGAGKSTVGVILAKTLGMDFMDSDLLICHETGKTLQEILDRDGQAAFLQLEEEIVRNISVTRTVLATGGSVPMRKAAMEYLKTQGKIVYLDVPLDELEARLGNLETRGIAFGPGETLETIYRYRTPIYREWADYTIAADLAHNTIEHMVGQIVSAIKGC